MQFPARDLTNQYISLSYHDVVQRFTQGTASYFLDGLGNVIAFVPLGSIGQKLITEDQIIPFSATASYSLFSEFADTASLAFEALFSETSSYAFLANNISFVPSAALSASWVSASNLINSSSYANTASYSANSSNAYAISFVPEAANSASWASSSISASFAATTISASKAISAETASYLTPRIVTVIGDYSIVGGNATVIVTGSVPSTITLPSSSVSFGVSLFIKNRLTVNMYVRTPDGATIDGDTTLTSSFKNTSIQLQCSGSEWFVL